MKATKTLIWRSTFSIQCRHYITPNDLELLYSLWTAFFQRYQSPASWEDQSKTPPLSISSQLSRSWQDKLSMWETRWLDRHLWGWGGGGVTARTWGYWREEGVIQGGNVFLSQNKHPEDHQQCLSLSLLWLADRKRVKLSGVWLVRASDWE